jgi:hypothetical protein
MGTILSHFATHNKSIWDNAKATFWITIGAEITTLAINYAISRSMTIFTIVVGAIASKPIFMPFTFIIVHVPLIILLVAHTLLPFPT